MNPRVGAGRTQAEFEAIMAALKLPKPKLIDVAVPANLKDGIVDPGTPTIAAPHPPSCGHGDKAALVDESYYYNI